MPSIPVDGKFPEDLLPLRDRVEHYVQVRLKLFAKAFAERVAPHLEAHEVEDATARTLGLHSGINGTSNAAALTTTPTGEIPKLRLTFLHDCLALGCRDAECTLCQFNPLRVCDRIFGKKYLVGDVLKAKCGAPIKVQLLDGNGNIFPDDLPRLHFEVNLIDGITFKERGGDGRILGDDELRACLKQNNHRDEALLQHKIGSSSSNRRIMLRVERGEATLPDLQVTDSSEALLTGRRPPFRLLVYAVDSNSNVDKAVTYAVSEEFVVATRRVKQANKADIPLVDDHISKIEHIGRETVKKMSDMQAASAEVGVGVHIPDHLLSITTVGQFQQLVHEADVDSQLRKVLQIILKLSKEKWDEASHHAMQAVVPDFRKRVWYPPGQGVRVGLVFNTKYGAVQLRDQVALMHSINGDVKTIPEDQLDPNNITILRQLKQQAVNSWWEQRHPGWGILRDSGELAAQYPVGPSQQAEVDAAPPAKRPRQPDPITSAAAAAAEVDAASPLQAMDAPELLRSLKAAQLFVAGGKNSSPKAKPPSASPFLPYSTPKASMTPALAQATELPTPMPPLPPQLPLTPPIGMSSGMPLQLQLAAQWGGIGGANGWPAGTAAATSAGTSPAGQLVVPLKIEPEDRPLHSHLQPVLGPAPFAAPFSSDHAAGGQQQQQAAPNTGSEASYPTQRPEADDKAEDGAAAPAASDEQHAESKGEAGSGALGPVRPVPINPMQVPGAAAAMVYYMPYHPGGMIAPGGATAGLLPGHLAGGGGGGGGLPMMLPAQLPLQVPLPPGATNLPGFGNVIMMPYMPGSNLASSAQ